MTKCNVFIRQSIFILILALVSTSAFSQTPKETDGLNVYRDDEEEMTDTLHHTPPNVRPVFKPGQVDVSVGIGLGSVLGASYMVSSSLMPPVSATADVGLSERISLGGYICMSKLSIPGVDYSGYPISATANFFLIGARGLYHFPLTKHLDTYAGLMVSYNAGKVQQDPNEMNVSMQTTFYDVLIGGRYRFAKNAAAFFELGYGVAILTIGMNVRF